MRPIAAVCALALAGCASFGSSGQEQIRSMVRLDPDTALRVAATQLQHHGYSVTELGNRTIITQPRAVPQYLRELSTNPSDPPQQLIFRVQTERAGFVSGTRIIVAGFLVPRSQTEGRTAPELRRAVPITEDNPRLFREVQIVAGWISDAANRKRGS
jgi:hypothetical protein